MTEVLCPTLHKKSLILITQVVFLLQHGHTHIHKVTDATNHPTDCNLGDSQRILKLWSLFSICHKLIRRSSADRYVAPSLFTEIELMWYVWALANTRRGLASTISSIGLNMGTRSDVIDDGSTGEPISSRRLKPSVRFRRSETFHSFTVLSRVPAKKHRYTNGHSEITNGQM